MNTPRTDANDLGWQFNEQYGDFDSLSDTPMPWLDFAKMLERELTAVTEQRDGLRSAVDYASDQLSKVTEQRDEARATCSELVVDSDAITLARTVVHITQERDEAREQRDRLAAALWSMLNQDHGSAIRAGILLRSLGLQYLNQPTEL